MEDLMGFEELDDNNVIDKNSIDGLFKTIINTNEDMISSTDDEYMFLTLQRQREDIERLKYMIEEIKK